MTKFRLDKQEKNSEEKSPVGPQQMLITVQASLASQPATNYSSHNKNRLKLPLELVLNGLIRSSNKLQDLGLTKVAKEQWIEASVRQVQET